MNGSGFVYVWFDRANRMYYVGSHWGAADDGYVCSSPWMKRAYARRPGDFKRRVLKQFSARGAMIDEENRLLSMIRDDELGVKYYNLNNKAWELWHHKPDSRKSTRERISETNRGRDLIGKERRAAVDIGKKISESKKGVPLSEAHRRALSAAHTGKKQSAETIEKRAESLRRAHAEGRHAGMRGKRWADVATPEETAEKGRKISAALTGKKLSADHKKKIADSGFGQHWTGKKRSPETVAKMAEARRAYWERKRAESGAVPKIRI